MTAGENLSIEDLRQIMSMNTFASDAWCLGNGIMPNAEINYHLFGIGGDVCTDGGTVLGFFDASQSQPYDNSRRVWYVDDPHVERPLVKTEDSAVGFYAHNGESIVTFKETDEKERICAVLERIREQNLGKQILLVLDKHGSHVCKHTRKRAHQLGIDLIFLPSSSPHLNPIEKVWDYLKWTMSPIIVEDEDEFKELVRGNFE